MPPRCHTPLKNAVGLRIGPSPSASADSQLPTTQAHRQHAPKPIGESSRKAEQAPERSSAPCRCQDRGSLMHQSHSTKANSPQRAQPPAGGHLKPASATDFPRCDSGQSATCRQALPARSAPERLTGVRGPRQVHGVPSNGRPRHTPSEMTSLARGVPHWGRRGPLLT